MAISSLVRCGATEGGAAVYANRTRREHGVEGNRLNVRREPACPVKWCPARSDPDFHVCALCGAVAVEHHHEENRGMGGSPSRRDDPENVFCLCHTHHEGVTTGGYTVAIEGRYAVMRNGKEQVVIKTPYSATRGTQGHEKGINPHKKRTPAEVIHVEVGSAAAEQGAPSTSAHMAQSGPESAAAPPASGESSVAEPLDKGALPIPARDSRLVPSPSATPPSFNLDSWCAEGMQLVYWGIALRDAKDEVRFRIGDWFNEGEAVLSDEALGYLRGFEDVTVRQYSWVAGRVSPDTRVSELAWTYHRAVAALEPPKQREWLEKAQEEHMSSKGLHQAIHGEKPRVKRWSFAELEGHLCHTCREVLSLMEAK